MRDCRPQPARFDWITNEEYAERWKTWEKLYLGRCVHYAQPEANQTLEKAHGSSSLKKLKENDG